MHLREDIPASLLPQAQAALEWINSERGTRFELTGLADSDPAPASEPGQTYELGLVVCDGEICAREQVVVTESNGQYGFAFAEAHAATIPPLLDPPLGLRRQWIDEQLGKFDFILLLFYRGRW